MNETVKSVNPVDEFSVRKHTARVLTPQEVDRVGGALPNWVYGGILVTTVIACTVAASGDGTETVTVLA